MFCTAYSSLAIAMTCYCYTERKLSLFCISRCTRESVIYSCSDISVTVAGTGVSGTVYLCGQSARMLRGVCYLQLYAILTELLEFRTNTWSKSGDETASESPVPFLLSYSVGDGTWICSYVQTWDSTVHCCTSSYNIHLIVSVHF
jgi:hypothetical protein